MARIPACEPRRPIPTSPANSSLPWVEGQRSLRPLFCSCSWTDSPLTHAVSPCWTVLSLLVSFLWILLPYLHFHPFLLSHLWSQPGPFLNARDRVECCERPYLRPPHPQDHSCSLFVSPCSSHILTLLLRQIDDVFISQLRTVRHRKVR